MYFAYSPSNQRGNLHTAAVASVPATAFRGRTFYAMKQLLRFLIVSVTLLVIVTFGAIVHAYAGSVSEEEERAAIASVSEQPSHIVVDRGETLWSIASAHMEQGENIRSRIAKIKKLNHLSSSALYEGQVLLLP